MPTALFGKLVAKRDFISVNTPRDLVLAWENWLQASLASSKNELKEQWLKAYLHAPLWRFWFGPEICGLAVTGVFMSSMDGVGRHFPLAVFSIAEEGRGFEAPSDALDQGWFEAAENFLLSTIDAGEDYDAVLAGLAALPAGGGQAPTRDEGCFTRHGAIVAMMPLVQDVPEAPVAATMPPDLSPELQVEASAAANPMAADAPGIVSGQEAEPPSDTDAPAREAAQEAAEEAALTTAPSCDGPAGNTQPDPGPAGSLAREVDGHSPEDAVSAAVPAPPAAEPATQPAAEPAVSGPVDVVAGPMPGIAAPGFGFAAIAAADGARANRSRSYWWTIGGHDVPAMAVMADGLPDPQLMVMLLTGAAPHAAA